MIQVIGPFPLSQPDAAGKNELHLRLNQRVSAEVMQVSATQAVLSVDGFPIVARLASADQASALKDQRTARFIVTQVDGNNIVLKLIPPGSAASREASGVKQEVAARFLSENQIPTTENNLTLMRALLNHKLPLSADLFNELSSILSKLGEWDSTLADLAAAVKAAGLPLTAESLALAASKQQNGADGFLTLLQQLKQMGNLEKLPDEMRYLLSATIDLLENTHPTLGQPRESVAQSIENQIKLLGRSIENILLEQSQGDNPFWPEHSLVILGRLQTIAKEMGETALANTLSRYLEHAHQTQFLNIQTGSSLSTQELIQVPLYLQSSNPAGEMIEQSAHLRVTRGSRQPGGAVDLNNSRLVIEMEIEEGQTIQVGLSFGGSQALADVTVTNDELIEAAEQEFPGFEEGMKELGFLLSRGVIKVGAPDRSTLLDSASPSPSNLITVNLEI